MGCNYLGITNRFLMACVMSLGLSLGGATCALANAEKAAQFARDAYNRGDYQAALDFWRPLADKGSPNAQFNIGRLFAAGLGVPQDFNKSLYWYMKAANQNDAEAQQMVGAMYGAGLGVKQSTVDAYMWFLLSMRTGRNGVNKVSTEDLLRDLEEVMAQQGSLITARQRQEAHERADLWRPQYR